MEFYPNLIENQGKLKDELNRDPKLNSLERFKDVDLSQLSSGEWWNICGDSSRLDQLTTFLQKRSEKIIAVVSHWGYIHNLIQALFLITLVLIQQILLITGMGLWLVFFSKLRVDTDYVGIS
jgi:hypothetical protein